MKRSLRAVVLTAIGLLAAAGIAAQAAQAIPFFTVPGSGASTETTVTVKKDGTGKTAHFVFDIRKADGSGVISFTCNEITAEAAIVGSSSEQITLVTPKFEGGGGGTACTAAGQSVNVVNTGCSFTLTAWGTFDIGSVLFHKCSDGSEPIELEGPFKCKVEIDSQTLIGAVKYSNLADGTITAQLSSSNVEYWASGVGCPYGLTSNGQLTTSNLILTGEQGTAGAMVNLTWDA